MSNLEDAELQLSELDLLSSMFPNEDEFKLIDQIALAELKDYVEKTPSEKPYSKIQFVLNVELETPDGNKVPLSLFCAFPLKYPGILPDITIRIRRLSWQRILIRHREDIHLEGAENKMEDQRKFLIFEEKIFDAHGARGNHMDMGQLYHFLLERGCADIFQLYFGVEGH